MQSVCFALYLGRYFRVETKNIAQVKKITECISRLKKKSSIVKLTKVAPLCQILNISTDHITGKDLTDETDFAANLKIDFDKLMCVNYVIDRNNKQDAFVIDFLFKNESPNHCDNIQIVEEFETCTCFHCSIEELV